MRLLLDEQISPDVAHRLRERGLDVESAVDVLRTKEDVILWRFAIEVHRAIVTYDKEDFLRLAVECFHNGEHHHGLILIAPRTVGTDEIGTLIRSLDALLSRGEDLTDQIRYLERID
jgi:predicted nuclease of predicted toxin-antitoxin system